MDQRRLALAAVIAASWLAPIGGMLIVWGLLGSRMEYFVVGGVSLALAAITSALALKLEGMPVSRPLVRRIPGIVHPAFRL